MLSNFFDQLVDLIAEDVFGVVVNEVLLVLRQQVEKLETRVDHDKEARVNTCLCTNSLGALPSIYFCKLNCSGGK